MASFFSILYIITIFQIAFNKKNFWPSGRKVIKQIQNPLKYPFLPSKQAFFGVLEPFSLPTFFFKTGRLPTFSDQMNALCKG